jgi:hypothetical protein
MTNKNRLWKTGMAYRGDGLSVGYYFCHERMCKVKQERALRLTDYEVEGSNPRTEGTFFA